MVSGLSGTTYLERLKEVGLTTFELRRQRGDMIEVWKILHQKDDVNPQTWFKMASESDRHTRQSANPWNLSTGTGNNDRETELLQYQGCGRMEQPSRLCKKCGNHEQF